MKAKQSNVRISVVEVLAISLLFGVILTVGFRNLAFGFNIESATSDAGGLPFSEEGYIPLPCDGEYHNITISGTYAAGERPGLYLYHCDLDGLFAHQTKKVLDYSEWPVEGSVSPEGGHATIILRVRCLKDCSEVRGPLGWSGTNKAKLFIQDVLGHVTPSVGSWPDFNHWICTCVNPIGYNITWLIITAISLMLAGGYLIWRRRKKMT